MQKRVHIRSAVNAANVSKQGGTYTIREVCGAVDDIVMNGVLYPAAELAAGVATLEGRPAPAGHPKNAAGQFISANSGDALLTAYAGAVCRNARHEGGRTLVDVVVNEAQAKAHPDGPKLIERLDAAIAGTNAEPIHVSTGLMLKPIAANGESRGKAYSAVATDLRYDHLAILLNDRGAGTPAEGVGMFLNSAGQEEQVEVWNIADAEEPADVPKAISWLKKAIALHEKHMAGTAPTTGKDGEKSQQLMMDQMRAALAALGGGDDDKAMKSMNTADRRTKGLGTWLNRLLMRRNVASELSFDQIREGLCRDLFAKAGEGAWLAEIFDRYAVWTDRDGKHWQQDYAVGSDGSVAFSGTPQQVRREVTYQPVANRQEIDTVRELIVNALTKAGISTAGKSDEQLAQDYAAMQAQPYVAAANEANQALTAANSKIAEFESAAKRAEEAELTDMATVLAANSSLLKVDDFKAMGLARLKELAKADPKAAPVITGNSRGAGDDEFAGYSLNSHLEAKQ